MPISATPTPTSLINDNLATLWRWCEPRLPVFISPVYSGTRMIADFSSQELKDENSENPFVRRLSAIPDEFVLDGKLIDGVFWVDDVPYLEGDLTKKPYKDRYPIVNNFYDSWLSGSELFALVPTFTASTQADLEYFTNSISEHFQDSRGISFKGSNYLYTGGKNPNWLVLDAVIKAEKEIKDSGIPRTNENSVQLNKNNKIDLNRIIKTDIEQQIVTGVVLEPDTIDAQGDIISGSEIEGAAHRFLKDSRVVGLKHLVEAPANIVESHIAPIDFDFNGAKILKGSWIISVKINDDKLWEEVKAGGINSFSIGGFGIREDLGQAT